MWVEQRRTSVGKEAVGCEISSPHAMTPLHLRGCFHALPGGLPVRKALLLQEATVVCKAMSHNSARLATDEPTPCADAATCFHEHFQDFPLGLHNRAGCWILGSCAEGPGRGTAITAFNIGGQRKVRKVFTCARNVNKTLLIVCPFYLSFALFELSLSNLKETF